MNSRSKTYVVYDLETICDPDIERSEDERDRFPPPICHEIKAFSMATFVPERVERETVFRIKSLGTAGGTERENIEAYGAYLENIDFCQVGFNNVGFDNNVIFNRALKLGVSLPALFLKGNKYDGPLRRYGMNYNIDLCDAFSNYGASPKASLAKFAQAVGLPAKLGVDGSQVAEMCAQGKIQEVKNYCEMDVLATGGLFLRFQRLRGILSGQGFRLSAQIFLDFIEQKAEEKPHLREFLDNVDLGRFFNAGCPSTSEEAYAATEVREQASKIQSSSKVKLKLVEDL